MDAYTSFAQVYDLFMDNVPYEQWSAFLCRILKKYGIEDGPVLDLGCGTGKLTRLMAKAGYDMTGVDSSAEMLQIALSQTGEEEILYLLQEMQELDLDGCVRAVYSACDCINYVLDEEELQEAFARVYEHLETGGVFLFDMNTDYKYTQLLGENTFAESREDGSFIWENYYDEEERINEYDLTLFIPEQDGLYRRFSETHYQRDYDLQQIKIMLEKAGFVCEAIYDDYSEETVHAESERAVFIGRKEYVKEKEIDNVRLYRTCNSSGCKHPCVCYHFKRTRRDRTKGSQHITDYDGSTRPTAFRSSDDGRDAQGGEGSAYTTDSVQRTGEGTYRYR